MRTGGRLVLYGERRMGKSSVIARAAEWIEAGGGVVIRADAWTVEDLDGLNRELMRSVPREWLIGDRLQSLLRSLRSMVSVSFDESGTPVLAFSGSVGSSSGADERLGRILRGLDEVASGSEAPVVVVVDEFQRLEELEEGSGGLLRGLVQETPHLAYVFAGSIVGLVMDLLGPKGPFHAVDRLEVEGIEPDHLVPWLQHRFEAHGVRAPRAAVEELFERSGPVTEYVMRLAKVVFRLANTAGEATSSTVSEAFEEVVSDYAGSFELIWTKLSPTKRQIMRALADGEEQLTSKAVLDRYDLSSSSAASYAIGELRRDGILAPGKPYRISDPFFQAWVLGSA
jgi:hypothetical protein